MLNINLTEPVVFLRGGSDAASSNRRRPTASDAPPAVLRGVLTLHLSKPTKIKSIEVDLSGTVKTEWPEGIGGRRVDIVEENSIFSASTVFFNASEHAATKHDTRRTRSLGPGIMMAGTANVNDESDETEQPPPPSRPRTPELQPSRSRGVSADTAHSFRQSVPANFTYQTPFEDDIPEDEPPAELLNSAQGTPTPTPGQTLQDLRNALIAENVLNIPPPSALGLLGGVQSQPRPGTISIPSRPIPSRAPSYATSDENSGPSTASSLRSTFPGGRDSFSEDRPGPLPAEGVSPNLTTVTHRRRSSFSTNITLGSPIRRIPTTPSVPESSPLLTPMTPMTPLTPPTDPGDSPVMNRGRPERRKRFSFSLAWQEMKDRVLPTRQRSIEAGHLLNLQGEESSHSRPQSPALAPPAPPAPPAPRESIAEEDSRGRDRKVVGKLGGTAHHHHLHLPHLPHLPHHHHHHNEHEPQEHWTEFKKGTYNWPIAFAIPADSPPSIRCEYGHVIYKLRAKVTRPGTFAPNWTTSTEVTLIASPGEDDTDENILVEREWDNQLRYMISLSGRSFAIGGTIPLHLMLMPLTKLSIYRIGAFLEEKVEYFAHDRKVSRHDPLRRFELLNIKHGDRMSAMLPITSDHPDAASSSSLAPYVEADSPSDVAQHLLTPAGPWTLHFQVRIPDCHTKIHFTHKYKQAKIVVSHVIKIVMRVGNDTQLPDGQTKRRQFDIIIESPITILSCRTNPEWISLPTYSLFPGNSPKHSFSCICEAPPDQLPTVPEPGTGDARVNSSQTQSPNHSPVNTPRHRDRSLPRRSRLRGSASPRGTPSNEILQDRTRQFARLVAGEEREDGEMPPSYETALLFSPRLAVS